MRSWDWLKGRRGLHGELFTQMTAGRYTRTRSAEKRARLGRCLSGRKREMNEKTIEVCPKCGSDRKEWMQRSPDGNSKCAQCGFEGKHTEWEKFKPYAPLEPVPSESDRVRAQELSDEFNWRMEEKEQVEKAFAEIRAESQTQLDAERALADKLAEALKSYEQIPLMRGLEIERWPAREALAEYEAARGAK